MSQTASPGKDQFGSDMLHPLRTLLIATTLQAFCSALPLVFLLLDVPPEGSFIVWCCVFGLSVPVSALFMASELPTYMKILPRDRYGQFSAATALVRSAFTILAGITCGAFIDLLQSLHTDRSRAYLYLPLWPCVLQELSALCLWKLHSRWKRLGGAIGYTPPVRQTAAPPINRQITSSAANPLVIISEW